MIRMIAGPVSAEARLNESQTATAIWKALPIAAKAETWGDEIYFGIGIDLESETPQEVVTAGEAIRSSSPVNVFGEATGDPTVFKKVRAGTRVSIERGE